MDKRDIVRKLGFPDKIVSKSMMDTGTWKCSKCGRIKLKGSKEPCECGSIFWVKGGIA